MFAVFNSQQRSKSFRPIGQNDTYQLDAPNVIQSGANRQGDVENKIDCAYLSFASIPNNFDEVHCNLIVTEVPLVGLPITVSIPLAGYFAFTRFATYLADALNASALTGVYTVVFAPAPYAQYTISSTVPFSFNLTRPLNDPVPLEDVSVHLGLERVVVSSTPSGGANVITSTKPVILNVNRVIMASFQGLEEGQCCGGFGVRFTFAIQVSADKDAVITHTGRRYTQIADVGEDFFQSRAGFVLNLTRADGGPLYNLADYDIMVQFAKSTPFIN